MVGYVLYSGHSHARWLRAPTDRAVLAVPPGALLPDLIHEFLAWQFAVLPAGRSLGHSLVVAVPLVALVLVVARAARASDVGVAFGYFVWPFASDGHPDTQDLLARVVALAGEFSQFVTGPGWWRFVVAEATRVVLTLAL